jgi:hypothetical protein
VLIAITLATILTGTMLIQPMPAATVAVRHTEGLIHGFLKLSTLEAKPLATGDLTQVARGDRVTNQLVFRFKDGSVHDETTVFSQGGTFRLLTYHLVQKGPTFPQAMDLAIDMSTGQVTVRYTDKGREKVESNKLELASDVANGLIFTLLKNINPKDPPTTVPFVAATPKPRLVKLVITPHGEEPFSVDATRRKATRYVLRADIGGFSGAIARLLGKQPPDIYVWVLGGPAPAFVKSEGPLYLGGPIWRIELTSPTWPHPATVSSGSAKNPTK